ncbi:MAG: helix-turn-helix transcriptional regulator [Bacteroidales bacterium]|nr:helix-turn-helix transcriptional regulator [Bacteroidales bacterium]
MKDRLQQFLDLEQLTPAKLADILEVQRSGLSHILSGRNKPGFDFINKLLTKFPSLNSDWLITGKGKVYKDSFATHIENSINSQQEKNQSNTLFSTENETTKPNLNEEHPSENSLFENERADTNKNKTLKKVLMFYSDNTFIEYYPQEDK